MPEGIDLTIENLKSRLSDIKQKISQLRKKGLDTKIAELKAMAVPARIKLVEATKGYKDVETVIKLLNEAEIEVKEIEQELSKSENQLNK